MEDRGISRAVIGRLPRYYRYLGDLSEAGVERISSNELSKKMRVTASQIRQDLNNFGGFGQQGYGYNVKYLRAEIGKILGLGCSHNTIIIGAGNLGQALAKYSSFERSGFVLKGIFDVNQSLQGVSIRGVPIRMMEELEPFLKENEIEIARAYDSEIQCLRSGGPAREERDQRNLEFRAYGSGTSERCHCRERTPFGQSDEIIV